MPDISSRVRICSLSCAAVAAALSPAKAGGKEAAAAAPPQPPPSLAVVVSLLPVLPAAWSLSSLVGLRAP